MWKRLKKYMTSKNLCAVGFAVLLTSVFYPFTVITTGVIVGIIIVGISLVWLSFDIME